MKNKIFALISTFATVTAFSMSPVMAQEGDTAPDDALSLGTPAEDQIGSSYTREVYGDWEMRCLKTEDGKDPCNLYQLLNDQNDNSVAEISLFGLPEGEQAAIGVTIVTPLETLLTRQVRLSIDEGPGKVYPFSFCNLQGCVSRVGLLADEVEALKRGVVAKMVIVPVADPKATVVLTMSLTGFTAGLNAVLDSNKANGL